MKSLFVVLLGLSLAGCATVGNGRLHSLQPAEARQALRPGLTTQAEARSLLGEARELRFASGWSTWVYAYRDGLPRALDFVPVVGLFTSAFEPPETELALLFDPEGRLQQFRLRRGEAQSR